MARIEKRGNSFRITVSLGYDNNGKQIRKTTTFKPPEGTTERKAEKLAADFARDFENRAKGTPAFNENMRFSELAKLYEEIGFLQLKPATQATYRIYLKKYLIPMFGTLKLSVFTPIIISQAFQEICTKDDGKDGKPQPRTVKRVYTALQAAFRFAVNQQILIDTPCRNVQLPKSEIKKIHALTLEQMQELLKICEPYSRLHTFVKLLLFTGMRSGEALGLMWNDIDFERKIIYIRRSLSIYLGKEKGEHGFELQEPKTKTSIRAIAIPQSLVDVLKEHRSEQEKEKAAAGELYTDKGLVFSTAIGGYVNRPFLLTQWHRETADTGLKDCTFHMLRHSNATLLLFNGAAMKEISAHLGHSSIRITSDTYTDVYAATEYKLADLLENALK